ncbi:hypothetical protein G195_001722 [Phytophthora kernoviae 00238/432]|uniref:AB hydrolase-1 domain-containing protein n=1 Tax=Phytophthora kernoviae 00238/432 TaxID=1284355 RepID=A0A8J4SN00_9STRA|nr:hypothetical protein G195_001722 [Phytophthora kernoviae 00238/432]
MGNDVLQLMDELKVDKAVLLGHSMGGYIALSIAQRHPERLNAFGLIHSTAYPDSEEGKEKRLRAVSTIQTEGIVHFVDGLVPGLFAPEHVESLSAQVTRVKEIGYQTAPQGATGAALAMRERPDRRDVLSATPLPVLLVAGEKDAVIPPEQAIGKVFTLKQQRKHTEALSELDELLRRQFGLNLSLLNSLPAEDVIEMFRFRGVIEVDNLQQAARLIEEEAYIYNEKSKVEGIDDHEKMESEDEALILSILTKSASKTAVDLSHNRKKQYVLEDGVPVSFLVELGIMSEEGRVLARKYDKFRQINRFLEMHELFDQIESSVMNPLLSHGILKERFSALATDAIRAKLLDLMGYKTQLLEFIDMEHTPKNILIRAILIWSGLVQTCFQGSLDEMLRWSLLAIFALLTAMLASRANGAQWFACGWQMAGGLLVLSGVLAACGVLPLPYGVMRTADPEISSAGARLGGLLQYPNAYGAVAGMYALERLVAAARAIARPLSAGRLIAALLPLMPAQAALLLSESRGAWLATGCAAVAAFALQRRGARLPLLLATAAPLACAAWLYRQLAAAQLAPAPVPGLLALAGSWAAALLGTLLLCRLWHSGARARAAALTATGLAGITATALAVASTADRMAAGVGTGLSRLQMWRDALKLWTEAPWMGHGGETWRSMFRAIQSSPYVGGEFTPNSTESWGSWPLDRVEESQPGTILNKP